MKITNPIALFHVETILEEVEGSLRRLGRDCIDLPRFHWQ